MKSKCLALLSGGLDSILAVRLVQEQGIEVIGLNFSSPFFSGEKAASAAKQLGINLVTVDLCKDKEFQGYMKMLRNPKHGYGSAINPCIDCHAFMLKKAESLMKKLGAEFIITGEVLNERPMSQTMGSLNIVEEESGLKGKLLRPLSARMLPETDAEKKGLVDRKKLLDISGRQRLRQFELAKGWKLDYPTPGGGCMLCEKEFAKKLRDLLEHNKKISSHDAELLKIGRHFRYKDCKIIVGRNEAENKILEKLAKGIILEAKDVSGPITIIEGKPDKAAIEIAAGLTAAYSDAKNEKIVTVKYGERKLNKSMTISPLSERETGKMRLVQ